MEIFKKQDGFKGEKIIVLPNDFVNTVSQHPLVAPLYITDVGFFPNARYHYINRSEGCDRNIIIFCVSGKGYVTVNSKRRQVCADNIILIKKGAPHIYEADEKDPWSIFWAHFNGENAGCFLDKISDDCLVLPVSIEKSSKLRIFFDETIDSIKSGYTFDNAIYISLVFSNLLGTLFFKSQNLISHENETPVEKSIQFMLTHISECLALAQLADNVNLSETHFTFLFKQKTGFSPIDYFLRLKIHMACQFLDTTDLKIVEISKRLGFNDPYYFSRVFSKIMGHSPTDYKNIPKG